MPSPFPGMDPYLEDPALWPDFQRQLVRCFHAILAPGLGDRYRASIVTRRYLASTEEHEEDFLEVRQRSAGRLVTLLDVVSPANKTTSAGRQAYLETRHLAKDAGASLVEIDLVLQGKPTLEYSREGLPDWQYVVTVTRLTQPERHEIYTATLRKRLPRFRLPLASDDRDTVLDMHTAFSRCCDMGGFRERIDYCADAPVVLSDEDSHWLDSLLIEQGLRGPAPPEEVRLAAYCIWEQEGRPDGRDKSQWQKALAEVRLRRRPDR